MLLSIFLLALINGLTIDTSEFYNGIRKYQEDGNGNPIHFRFEENDLYLCVTYTSVAGSESQQSYYVEGTSCSAEGVIEDTEITMQVSEIEVRGSFFYQQQSYHFINDVVTTNSDNVMDGTPDYDQIMSQLDPETLSLFPEYTSLDRRSLKTQVHLKPGQKNIYLYVDVDEPFLNKFETSYSASSYVILLFDRINRTIYHRIGFNLVVSQINIRTKPAFPHGSQNTHVYEVLKTFTDIAPKTKYAHIRIFLSSNLTTGGAACIGGLYYPNKSNNDEGNWVKEQIEDETGAFHEEELCHNNIMFWGHMDGTYSPAEFYGIAHELGHVFGGRHTHGQELKLDSCGHRTQMYQSWNGRYSKSTNCKDGSTLMSYCHLCPEGFAKLKYHFHEKNLDYIYADYSNKHQKLNFVRRLPKSSQHKVFGKYVDPMVFTDGKAMKRSQFHGEGFNKVGSNIAGWGGTCTCPDGGVYQVSDNFNACGSLNCNGGIAGKCNREYGVWSYKSVTCGSCTYKQNELIYENKSKKLYVYNNGELQEISKEMKDNDCDFFFLNPVAKRVDTLNVYCSKGGHYNTKNCRKNSARIHTKLHTGCPSLTRDECCHFKDNRVNTRYANQPCVASKDQFFSKHGNQCEPANWAIQHVRDEIVTCAVEENHCVTVVGTTHQNDKNRGKYFNFNRQDLEGVINHSYKRENFNIYQRRKGKVIAQRKIVVWNAKGKGQSIGNNHGRFDDGKQKSGDWKIDDEFCFTKTPKGNKPKPNSSALKRTEKKCSDENGVCNCHGEIKYGHGDNWSGWKRSNGLFACNSLVFGDPKPHTWKICVCRPPPKVKYQEKKCSNENGICICKGHIKYGVGNHWTNWKPMPLSHIIACNTLVFGDPKFGTWKHCVCREQVTHGRRLLEKSEVESNVYSDPDSNNESMENF